MPTYHHDFTVPAPPGRVTARLADVERQLRETPGTVSTTCTTPGVPAGPGSTWVHVSRAGRRTVEQQVQLVVLTSHQVTTTSRAPGMTVTEHVTVEPDGPGTRVRMRTRVELHGGLRLLGPVLAVQLGQAVRQSAARTRHDLAGA